VSRYGKRKAEPRPIGRFQVIAYYPTPNGLWRPVASPWFVTPAEPILLARDMLERHHATHQRAAAAVINGTGAVVWQGYTNAGSEIRIQQNRLHLSRSKALDSGGGV
jgi:hypothetical protein